MVTVCIFELRNAMRTVQTAFKISSLSTKHTVPDVSKEVNALAEALEENGIQTYQINRPTNELIKPVRDLLEEGAKYFNNRQAFHTFRTDNHKPVNLGFQEPTVGDSGATEDKEEEESHQEEYEAMREDLEMDDEEMYEGGVIDNLIMALTSEDMDSM